MISFFKGFLYAYRGIQYTILSERNFRFHLVALLCVVAAGLHFSISRMEWGMVLLAGALVLSAEMINTAIERLCDLHSTERDPRIAVIKDVSAGAVLVCALAAAVVGVLVFMEKI